LGFIKKATPPPDVEEGQILKAKIMDIKKVMSKWKDDTGNLKEQLEFDLELEDGYKFKSWLTFYEQPSDKSNLGRLVLKFMEATKKDSDNVEEFMSSLKKFGQLFVKVKGFRDYEEQVYPNFAVFVEKIPGFQQKLKKKQDAKLESETKQFDARQLLTQFKDAIALGLPLNQDDWNRKLLVEERLFLFKQGLIEKRQDLYYFTAKAQGLFQQNANL
jgi:hypothetical protein